MKMIPLRAAVLFAGTLFGSLEVRADVVEQSVPVTFSNAGSEPSGSGMTTVVNDGVFKGTFQPFDTSRGTLVSCTVSFSATVNFAGTADSSANEAGRIEATLGGTFLIDERTFNGTGNGIEPVTAPPGDAISATLQVEPFFFVFRTGEAGMSYDPAILDTFLGQQDFAFEFRPSGNMVSYTNILALAISGNGVLNVTYEYEPATPPVPPEVTGMVRQPASGDVTLKWKSAAGARYAVDASADLTAWSEVAAGVEAGAGSETTWTETNIPAGTARRFYKVRRIN